MRETQIEKLFNETWLVRVAILVSLFLQVLLLFVAPLRKRTSNFLIQTLVYSVYKLSTLVADAAFALTVGGRWLSLTPARAPSELWGAFTLLHLAGQEGLTAYSLDDCDAWLTSSFTLAGHYFFHFLIGMWSPGKGGGAGDRQLSFLTTLVFSLALVRLLAQTLRLRFGMLEMGGFSQLPDPYPLILLDNNNNNNGNAHERLLLSSPPSSTDSDSTLFNVLEARRLLTSSLRLIAGIKHGHGRHSRDSFQKFLRLGDSKRAIRSVEIELNFIYDSFYTDGIIRKHLGEWYSLIYASLSCYAPLCSVIALVAFMISSHESGADDYSVTCILLWGTLILEFLSYLTTVFSDWTIASLGKDFGGSILLSVAPHRWHWHWWSDDVGAAMSWVRYGARVMFRRWSETVSKFNFLAYSIRQRVEKPMDYIRPDVLTGIAESIRSFRFVYSEWYTDELGIFIVDELRKKPIDKISLLRREWGEDDSYKRSVLTWHIATEVLYNLEQQQSKDCHRSKLLSDYMGYLLFMKPRFLSRLRGNPLVGVEAARSYVKTIIEMHLQGGDSNVHLRRCCQEILNLSPEGEGQGNDAEREIMYDVNSKLTQLRSVGTVDLWKTISEMWVEILLYAASESDPVEHLRGLCRGGELVSLVWLLAFHLGFF